MKGMCCSFHDSHPTTVLAAQCKAVITCNEGVRGGRLIPLKTTVDAALKSCPSVHHVFISQRTETPAPMGGLDVPLEQVRRVMELL